MQLWGFGTIPGGFEGDGGDREGAGGATWWQNRILAFLDILRPGGVREGYLGTFRVSGGATWWPWPFSRFSAFWQVLGNIARLG